MDFFRFLIVRTFHFYSLFLILFQTNKATTFTNVGTIYETVGLQQSRSYVG